MPRFPHMSLWLAGVLVLALMAPPARAETDTATRRAERETRAVLRAWIADREKPLQPCDLADSWLSDHRIRVADARKLLGLNRRIGVVVPHGDRPLTETIAPDEAMARILCNEAAYHDQRRRRLQAFDAGEIEGETQPRRKLIEERITLGHPVFASDFETAAFEARFDLVVRHYDPEKAARSPGSSWPNGVSSRANYYLSMQRYVYRKRGTVWVKIVDEETLRGG